MIEPTWYPTDKQLKQFAVICLPGFGLVGLMLWLSGATPTTAYVLAGIGAAAMAIGLTSPRALLPVYVLLIGVTLPIGWLVSNVLLRVIFYAVLTPIGLVFRLTGRDALQLKKPDTNTYWTPHTQRRDPASYFRQA